MGAYQTKKLADVLHQRFEEVYLVSAGFLLENESGDFESMPLFLREQEGLKFNFITKGNKDVREVTLGHGFEIKGAVNIYDTSVATLRNLLLLAKHPIQLYAKSVDGVHLNFYGNYKLSMNVKYIINEQKRVVELTFMGEMTNSEADTLITESVAFETGETGGTALGLTEVTDTRSKYIQPGFDNFLAGVSGSEVNIGEFEDAEFTLETTGTPLHRGRNVNRMVRAGFTIKGKQDALLNFGGAIEHQRSEWKFRAVDRNATPATWSFTGLGVDTDFSIGEQYGGNSLTLAGLYPMNPDWETPAFIDLDTPAAPVFTNIY